MRRLRDTDGSSVHRRHIRFHQSSCKGVSPLHDKLHDDAEVVYDALVKAQRAREDADDLVATAYAGRWRAELVLEDAIREIDAEAKKLDRHDPALAAQSTIFPGGLKPVLKPEGEAQLGVLPKLRVAFAPYAAKGEMAAAIAALDAAETALRAAVDAVKAKEEAAQTAFAEEKAARRAANEQLQSAFGQLRAFYKAQPKAANGFFLKEKAEKKGKKKVGEGANTG